MGMELPCTCDKVGGPPISPRFLFFCFNSYQLRLRTWSGRASFMEGETKPKVLGSVRRSWATLLDVAVCINK